MVCGDGDSFYFQIRLDDFVDIFRCNIDVYAEMKSVLDTKLLLLFIPGEVRK